MPLPAVSTSPIGFGAAARPWCAAVAAPAAEGDPGSSTVASLLAALPSTVASSPLELPAGEPKRTVSTLPRRASEPAELPAELLTAPRRGLRPRSGPTAIPAPPMAPAPRNRRSTASTGWYSSGCCCGSARDGKPDARPPGRPDGDGSCDRCADAEPEPGVDLVVSGVALAPRGCGPAGELPADRTITTGPEASVDPIAAAPGPAAGVATVCRVSAEGEVTGAVGDGEPPKLRRLGTRSSDDRSPLRSRSRSPLRSRSRSRCAEIDCSTGRKVPARPVTPGSDSGARTGDCWLLLRPRLFSPSIVTVLSGCSCSSPAAAAPDVAWCASEVAWRDVSVC